MYNNIYICTIGNSSKELIRPYKARNSNSNSNSNSKSNNNSNSNTTQ